MVDVYSFELKQVRARLHFAMKPLLKKSHKHPQVRLVDFTAFYLHSFDDDRMISILIFCFSFVLFSVVFECNQIAEGENSQL